ncbi:C1 family peptidase [Xylella fastidiosa]|uniref:C1 family peptidase n=1 Tax=Xylella fastidiosa TaxID=2371 RepID=UPI001E38C8C3|nr:C1 family peptidase [Xylella fastidiosa]
MYNSWVGNNLLPVRIPLPTKNDTLEGGHAVLCVGYDDEIRHFRIRNSWGNNVGEDGYFWMPYEYISNTQLADDFWVIKTVRK